ncbi:hypothetical protein BC939DRAFT_463059 [Gamsiella multidivaricata]|uniref:uncharacterized protein n=1 Tax=Gamsiella multidivaricata TaxID=101098 RepID=UPI00221F9517|nr:uncharacterized protein BC939DRAFT_463059 [Gamsiella multidivaricata]KAI7818381.1 hypothetical protein BC939DRAFT_463059 [Gamsiella multidivaricata]
MSFWHIFVAKGTKKKPIPRCMHVLPLHISTFFIVFSSFILGVQPPTFMREVLAVYVARSPFQGTGNDAGCASLWGSRIQLFFIFYFFLFLTTGCCCLLLLVKRTKLTAWTCILHTISSSFLFIVVVTPLIFSSPPLPPCLPLFVSAAISCLHTYPGLLRGNRRAIQRAGRGLCSVQGQPSA